MHLSTQLSTLEPVFTRLTRPLPGFLLRNLAIAKEKPTDSNAEEPLQDPFATPRGGQQVDEQTPTSPHTELLARSRASPECDRAAQDQPVLDGSSHSLDILGSAAKGLGSNPSSGTWTSNVRPLTTPTSWVRD